MFNHIADHSIRAGMESTHLKPDFLAVNDTSPPAKTTASAGLNDTSFGDFLSQRREPEQVLDKGRVNKNSLQDGAEILNSLTSDDDAAKINQIQSILEQQLRILCDEIISASMLSIGDILEILLLENVIASDLYYSLNKALKICDQSAQDARIDSGSMEFLYSLFPYLYNLLTQIYLKKRSAYLWTCPRCGCVGDTVERICPKCGYVF